jgi:hypothetical protein
LTGTDRVAQIEMLYQQRITVQIPVRDLPAGPDFAYQLVKNTKPEFVADVLATTWMGLATSGDSSNTVFY